MRQRALTLLLLGLAACASEPEARRSVSDPEVPPPLHFEGSAFEAAARVTLPEVPPGEFEGLHNIYRLGDSIISGAEPQGEVALRQLADWGVRTILSVDGKMPDAETAAALGMRYVHVPIQYKGMTEEELTKIAKTFRELEGPFYVHCFHGKHRGPAAAAVGRIVVDGLPREQAIAEMRQWCSTSSKYEGLYASVATETIPTAEQTRRFEFDFAPQHSFDGLRAAMIPLARKWDLIKEAEERGWAADPAHPDVEPLQEAIQVHQLLSASAQQDLTRYQDDFQVWMEQARGASERLQRALSDCSQEAELSAPGAWRVEADAAFELLAESCSKCHGKYRN